MKSATKAGNARQGPTFPMTPFTQITALLEEAGVMAHPFETALIVCLRRIKTYLPGPRMRSDNRS